MDIRMYGVGTETTLTATTNNAGAEAWRNDGDEMYVYFLFMNPWDADNVVADTEVNTDTPYDGMLATLTWGDPSSAANPVLLDSEATYTDINCENSLTDGKYDSSSCGTADTTNDYVAVAPANNDHCTVKWTVGTDEYRCVRASVTVKRALAINTAEDDDILWTTRAYSVTTGW